MVVKQYFSMSKKLVKGLIAHEKAAYYQFYDEFGPIARQVMRQHAHIKSINSEDLLQEAFLILYQRISDGTLETDEQLKPYFAQVCHFFCKNYTRRKANQCEIPTSPDAIPPFGESSTPIDYASHERSVLYTRYFSQLGAICRQLLTLFFQKTPMATIAERLRLPNANAVRARKHRCLKRLEDGIRQDPRYQELRHDSNNA